MNQEFVIGQLKIIEDEQGYGVVIGKDNNTNWEVIATFKYPTDAMRYFTEILVSLDEPLINNEDK